MRTSKTPLRMYAVSSVARVPEHGRMRKVPVERRYERPPTFRIHPSNSPRRKISEQGPMNIPSRLPEPPRHSRTSLTARQFPPAIDAAFYRPNSPSYQPQPSFHAHSTEPEPTARARRAGEEFYSTTPEFMFVSFRLLGVESVHTARTPS